MWLRSKLRYLKPVLLIFIILIIIFSITIKPIRINGNSMSPSLLNNKLTLANKLGRVKRFSIIAFKASYIDNQAPKNKVYVKRVIGLPGESINYSKDGNLYINDKKITQPFIDSKNRTIGTLNPKISNIKLDGFNLKSINALNNLKSDSNKVPKDYYFVLGDNRSQSFDSRFFGCVPKESIIGTVYQLP